LRNQHRVDATKPAAEIRIARLAVIQPASVKPSKKLKKFLTSLTLFCRVLCIEEYSSGQRHPQGESK